MEDDNRVQGRSGPSIASILFFAGTVEHDAAGIARRAAPPALGASISR
jgi:hypothetical protein